MHPKPQAHPPTEATVGTLDKPEKVALVAVLHYMTASAERLYVLNEIGSARPQAYLMIHGQLLTTRAAAGGAGIVVSLKAGQPLIHINSSSTGILLPKPTVSVV